MQLAVSGTAREVVQIPTQTPPLPALLLSQVMGVVNVLMDLTKLQMCLILPGYNSKPAKRTRCLSTVCITVQMIIWLVRFQIPGTGCLGEFRITFISQAI